MPVDLDELRDVLERARSRVVGIIAGVGVAVLGTDLVAASAGVDAGALVWFGVSGLVVGAVAWLWYRARARAIAQLVLAVERGAALYGCEVTRVLLNYVIPCGYEVQMWAVDAAKTREHLAFGFWRRRDAERLVALVQPHRVAGPLPPIEVTLWRPSGRRDGTALPTATARRVR